jgi:hypothetical protein
MFDDADDAAVIAEITAGTRAEAAGSAVRRTPQT